MSESLDGRKGRWEVVETEEGEKVGNGQDCK